MKQAVEAKIEESHQELSFRTKTGTKRHCSLLFSRSKKKQPDLNDSTENDNEFEVFNPSNSEDNSSDSEDDQEEIIDPSKFKHLDKEPNINDFVLVKFEPRDNRDIYYIAKIIATKDNNGDVEVSF